MHKDINVNVSGPVQPTSTYKTVVLKGNHSFASQVTEPNTKYVIKHDFVLDGDVTIPNNCVLEFDGGSISGEHTITGQNTIINSLLIPIFNNIALSGSFVNLEYYSDWFVQDTFIKNVMNINDEAKIILNRDIILNNTDLVEDATAVISHLFIDGNGYTIYNCDVFNVAGDCEIYDTNFIFTATKNYGGATRNIVTWRNYGKSNYTIKCVLHNVNIDGNKYLSGVVGYHPYHIRTVSSPVELNLVNIDIRNCSFSSLNRYAIYIRSAVTGVISNNTIKNIGWEKEDSDISDTLYSGIGIRLGWDYIDSTPSSLGYHCFDTVIENNNFQNIVSTYSNVNDGRENHFVLCYGRNIVAQYNYCKSLSTFFESWNNPGCDSEAIYIKGVFSKVLNNTIINGAGIESDGAIVLKGTNYYNNVVAGNRLIYDGSTVGVGIRLGGYNNILENNTIDISNAVSDGGTFILIPKSTDAACIIRGNNTIYSTYRLYNWLVADTVKRIEVVDNIICAKNSAILNDSTQDRFIVKSNQIICDENIISATTKTENCLKCNNAEIEDNTITFENLNIKNLLQCIGTSYVQVKNVFNIRNCFVESILRGTCDITIADNIYIINGTTFTNVNRQRLLGETSAIAKGQVSGNIVYGISMLPSLVPVTDCRESSKRPVIANTGFRFFDITLKKPIYFDGSHWIDNDGYTVVAKKGTTENRPLGRYNKRDGTSRPTDGKKLYVGFTWKNTNENKFYVISEIASNGTITWVEENTLTTNTIPSDARRSGHTYQRPSAEYVYTNLYNGYDYYDTDLKWPFYATVQRIGDGTTERPYVYQITWTPRVYQTEVLIAEDVGFEYFDTTLNKIIYTSAISNDTVTWIDATGATV